MNVNLEKAALISSLILGWSFVQPQLFLGEAAAQTGDPALPVSPPAHRVLEFTGPEVGWPPRPKDAVSLREPSGRPLPESLTDSLAADIGAAAVKSPEVRKALGARFAFIELHEVEPLKNSEAFEQFRTQMTFYSYTNNIAVQVGMTGLKVDRVLTRPGFQPPESVAEIKEAIVLALKDSRLRGKVSGLVPRGILSATHPARPGDGNRVMWVTFSKGDGRAPLYWAAVDLTSGRVLGAGPIFTRKTN